MNFVKKSEKSAKNAKNAKKRKKAQKRPKNSVFSSSARVLPGVFQKSAKNGTFSCFFVFFPVCPGPKNGVPGPLFFGGQAET